MKADSLNIKNFNKTIRGIPIIARVTATFLPGRITALVGPNGAGKTTLFNLITGELKPDSGKLFYKSEDITGLPPYKIARKGLGRLFQDVRIFEDMTVLENVTSACFSKEVENPWFPIVHRKRLKDINKEAYEKALFWLDFVGLSETLYSEGISLSYGQQKLLAIARILAGDFSLFLLDEPTSGLNPIMIKKVLNVLEKIVTEHPDKTIVLVEHNMSVVTEISDWVYFMNEGRISFFGKTDHVLGDKEVRETYLGL